MLTHTQPAQAPARVVVLGARGFIGAALKRRLERDAMNVLGLASAEFDLAAPGADERLVRILKGNDAMVMLAALTPDKGRGVATLMRNLAMMQNLCATLEKTNCAHLVYFSSDAVYGPGPDRVSEETPAAPQDLYGVMHLARELMARTVKAPVLVLRPTLVYGEADTHNAYGPNRFRRAAQKDGKIHLFGGGEETRDHIHVDDVAKFAARCLMRRSTGTLNLATGRSLSFRQVAELVASQAGRQVEVASAARANPITHRSYDITALMRAFPDFHFVSLEEGIGSSIAAGAGA